MSDSKWDSESIQAALIRGASGHDFILRAVNSHDALVEALGIWLEYELELGNPPSTDNPDEAMSWAVHLGELRRKATGKSYEILNKVKNET
jgi:hypothetical protein